MDGGHMPLCDVIVSDAKSRSRVLSCVVEGGGEAKLPDSLTESDFRKWLTAVADSDANFRNRSFASMCTIIKVADAVDDMLIDGWLRVAAERLGENKLSSCSADIKHDILDGLILLPDQLRQRLLDVAAYDPEKLERLLDFFPTGLHSAVVGAVINRDKVLQMSLTCTSYPALRALASLPASPPSVMALHIDTNRADQRGQKIGGDIWSCLRQALQHHSGLTSLRLSPSPSTDKTSQAHLLPVVATLTSLCSLDLQGCNIYEDSSLVLKATLQSLSQLHALGLRFYEKHYTSSQNRCEDDDARPPHCLASILSAATALTSLDVRVHQRTTPGHPRCYTAAAPLHMPQLVQLTAIFNSNIHMSHMFGPGQSYDDDIHLAARFFSHLTAPLTSLTFGEEGLQGPERLHPAAAGEAERLIRSLAAFTQLRCLTAVLPRDEYGHSSVSDALTSALPGLIEALHQPLSLCISSSPAVVQCIAPLLTTTTLTKLHLHRGIGLSASEGLLQRMRQWELRDLSLNFRLASPLASGLAALNSLMQLTALHLEGWDCLDRPADWQALAAMTCMQRLSLGGVGRTKHICRGIAVPEACIASMHALSALTSLTVISAEDSADAVVRRLAAQPLPALQELTLALFEPFDAVAEVARCVAALPALSRLTVHLHRPAGVGHAPSSLDLDSEDHPDNISLARFDDAEKFLREAAARAGVRLWIEEHGFD